jgi:DNA primase
MIGTRRGPLAVADGWGCAPLHADHEQSSFLVDPHKDLFYCYGCGRGGDVIRFAELYHQVKFLQALLLLRQWHVADPPFNLYVPSLPRLRMADRRL